MQIIIKLKGLPGKSCTLRVLVIANGKWLKALLY